MTINSGLDIYDVLINGWILTVESTIFQCQATAEEVKVAS